MRELQRRGDPNVVIALAGNKADMVTKRQVDAEVADEYAKDNHLIYMDTSAKTAQNVKALFDEIGALLSLLLLVVVLLLLLLSGRRGGRLVCWLWLVS